MVDRRDAVMENCMIEEPDPGYPWCPDCGAEWAACECRQPEERADVPQEWLPPLPLVDTEEESWVF